MQNSVKHIQFLLDRDEIEEALRQASKYFEKKGPLEKSEKCNALKSDYIGFAFNYSSGISSKEQFQSELATIKEVLQSLIQIAPIEEVEVPPVIEPKPPKFSPPKWRFALWFTLIYSLSIAFYLLSSTDSLSWLLTNEDSIEVFGIYPTTPDQQPDNSPRLLPEPRTVLHRIYVSFKSDVSSIKAENLVNALNRRGAEATKKLLNGPKGMNDEFGTFSQEDPVDFIFLLLDKNSSKDSEFLLESMDFAMVHGAELVLIATDAYSAKEHEKSLESSIFFDASAYFTRNGLQEDELFFKELINTLKNQN